jgi:DNA mismatch repair protein MSH3
MHGAFEDGGLRPELEARLLRVAPAEVLLVEPLSAATTKLVYAMYGGGGTGAGTGVRVERVAASSGYCNGGAAAAVAAAVTEAGGCGEHAATPRSAMTKKTGSAIADSGRGAGHSSGSGGGEGSVEGDGHGGDRGGVVGGDPKP